MSQNYTNLSAKKTISGIIKKIVAGDRKEEQATFIKILEIGERIINGRYVDKQSIYTQAESIRAYQDLLINSAINACHKKGKCTLTEQEQSDLISYFSGPDYSTQLAIIDTMKQNIADSITKHTLS